MWIRAKYRSTDISKSWIKSLREEIEVLLVKYKDLNEIFERINDKTKISY